MSTIDWPRDHRDFQAESFEMWAPPHVLRTRSVPTNYPKTRELSGTRWACAFVLGGGDWRRRARQSALLESLEGGANRLRMWHLARPRPYGTISGAPVVQAAASAGAKAVSIQTATAGETLEMGDLVGLGVGGPLVKAAARAISAGSPPVMTVALTHGIWADVAVNAPVILIRPTALWVPVGELRTDRYSAGNLAEPIDLQFEEVFE